MNISKLKYLMIIFIFSIVTVACGQEEATKVTATICYLIEIDDDEVKEKQFDYGRELIPRFNRFARTQSLETPAGESAGGQYVYKKPEEGTQISLTFGMGTRRAETALYTDGKSYCDLCSAYEDFMQNDLGSGYRIIPCNEVEGYRTPELWNVDLRKSD